MNSTSPGGQAMDSATPSDEDMRDALARILASEAFVSAPRLQQFLSYVVEEAIAGRGATIKGKNIAVDVYDRDLRGESGQNLVRVEARRLRRRLQEYYSSSGADDPLHIIIDLGGYTPRFESNAAAALDADDTLLPARRTELPTKAILSGLIVLMAVLAIAVLFDVDEPESNAPDNEARRAAYHERSPQALQAVNLAEQTRGMLFPIFDVKRQELALEMFRHSIELDPGLHHGYAGSAQALANLALMVPDGTADSTYLVEATRMAAKALDVAPTDAWALSSNGWVKAVAGDLEGSLLAAHRAIELAPRDGHILDIAGSIAIVANAAQFAADVSDPGRPRSGIGRFAAQNIWGVSQLMLGNYENVVEAFSSAPEAGAPVSAPSLIFLAVAYDHLGDTEKAERTVSELKMSWPEFPVVTIISKVFQNSSEVGADVLERLASYGYPE